MKELKLANVLFPVLIWGLALQIWHGLQFFFVLRLDTDWLLQSAIFVFFLFTVRSSKRVQKFIRKNTLLNGLVLCFRHLQTLTSSEMYWQLLVFLSVEKGLLIHSFHGREGQMQTVRYLEQEVKSPLFSQLWTSTLLKTYEKMSQKSTSFSLMLSVMLWTQTKSWSETLHIF